jgi:hypothetical protein
MTVIHALCQFLQFFRHIVDERYFLCSGPALDLFFAVESGVYAVVQFDIYQFYGQSFFGVIRAFAVLVLPQSTLEINCTSRVKGTV